MELIDRVKMVLKQTIEDCPNLENVKADDDLTEYGITSISFMQLVIALELEFDIEWSDDALDYSNFLTINNIIGYLNETVEQ